MGLVRAVLGLCVAAALFLSGCSGLLYYPTRHLHYDPGQFGLTPEEVYFQSADGKSKLFGWYFRTQSGKKSKATVVQFHGNGENMSSHYLSLTWILKHPYDLFVFDYQGYGRSEGSPSPENTVKDGIAALELVHQKSKLPLVVVGQSLGGAIAMRSVIDQKGRLPIRYLMVDSSFTSYRSMARQVMARNWVTWPLQWLGWLLMSDTFAPKGAIDQISPIPLLVVHGKLDFTVGYENGERIFAEARDPKEFWEIKAGGHTDVFTIQPATYKDRFLERLSSALKDSP